MSQLTIFPTPDPDETSKRGIKSPAYSRPNTAPSPKPRSSRASVNTTSPIQPKPEPLVQCGVPTGNLADSSSHCVSAAYGLCRCNYPISIPGLDADYCSRCGWVTRLGGRV